MNNPSLLFHYTTAAGLLGMISGKLWLSQIQYMNDSREYHHVFDIAKERLLYYTCVGESCKRSLSGKLHEYFQNSRTMSRTYVFAMSEKRDLLSQWRAYAPDGGYCIGFDFEAIKSFGMMNNLKLVRCIYNKDEKVAHIDRCISSALSQINAWPIKDDLYHSILFKLVGELRTFTDYFKHESFEEEVEWRMVGLVAANDNRSKWRAKDSLIIPYCELDCDFKGIVKEIIIGPKMDKELSTHGLDSLFMNLGYKVPISKSPSSWE